MLFVGYRQAATALAKTHTEKETVLSHQRLQLRLGQIFRAAESCQQISSDKFLIQYQGGVDPDPRFRGPLEGYLYTNKKQLLLISRPEEGDPRLEVLHDNVSAISFLFFDIKSGCFTENFPIIKPFMMQVRIPTENDPNFTLPLFL